MASDEISAAIETAQEKKESLRKSFEAVQGFSSALLSLSFKWKDLDDHFSSIQRSIEARFKELETMEARAVAGAAQPELLAATAAAKPESTSAPESTAPLEAVVPRMDLAVLCAGMDAQGLRAFISENRKEIDRIRQELLPALRLASDPATLVYDVIEEYRPSMQKDPDGNLLAFRRTCINLLVSLKDITPLEISPELREKTKKLGEVWMENIQEGGDDLEVHAFLELLRSYGLVSEFDMDDVLDMIVLISKRKHTLELCKGLGLVDHIPDLIQKMVNKGKHVDAVKFVFEFDLQDKFPPDSLIRDYLKVSRKLARELTQTKNGNTSAQAVLNTATGKEIGSINAVIKVVKEFNLAKYSVEELQKRIVRLQQKLSRKRSVADLDAQPRQLLNKQPRLPNVARRPMHDYEPQEALAPSRYHPAGAGYGLPPLADREYIPGMSHYKPTGALLPEGQGRLTSPPGQYRYPDSQSSSHYYDRPLLPPPLPPPSAYSYPLPGLSRSYAPPYL